MGKHTKNKKDMKFQSQSALKSVQDVLDEANAALNDGSRTIKTSSIPKVLTSAVSLGTAGTIGFAALYAGGSVAGLGAAGMASGLAATGTIVGGAMTGLIAPAAIVVGVGVAQLRNKKLREAKELCYKEAVKKQAAIIKALKLESRADKERIEYLNSLNTVLRSAIKDLRYDLDRI